MEPLDTAGLETVRILFPDAHGVLRGKALVASALPAALEEGIMAPATLLLKDTSHRTVFPVWEAGSDAPMQGAGDIRLLPDPSTFRRLPWSPHSAWVLCDTVMKDGAAIPFAPRDVLRRTVKDLSAQGLALTIGIEIEFHVYALTGQPTHSDSTMPPQPPGTRPIAHGYQYLTDGVYDLLEPVLDDLRRTAQAMDMPVMSTEVEMGPGQVEFTFAPGDPLEQADLLVMFRTMVKQVCARRGLHATFMCRPRIDNAVASGWHIHQSLSHRKTGPNLFIPQGDRLSPHAHGWVAGLLAHAAESCLLTTPTITGYKRYQPYQLAPDRIQWGRDNRGAMLRALMAPGDAASRIENRVPETAANPYYAIASQIVSGMDGLKRRLVAPAPVEAPYASDARRLPVNLAEAIAAFDGSTLYRAELGDAFVDYLCALKRAEWNRYLGHLSEWEQAEYFSVF